MSGVQDQAGGPAAYTLGEAIGVGPHGRVHQGRLPGGAEIAVKILRAELSHRPGVAEALTGARGLLRSISHPNVVQVIDILRDGENLAILSERVHGGALAHSVPRSSPVDALRLTAQLADGLAAVHAAGTLHGDLKGSNVLCEIESDGHLRVRLTDVGLQRLIIAGSGSRGDLPGTPGYVAPEVGLGAEPSAASDVYALGVILFELCTGTHPFAAQGPVALVLAHANQPLRRPDGLPDPVWELIGELMAKQPADRPTADEAATRLRSVLHRVERGESAAPGVPKPDFFAAAMAATATAAARTSAAAPAVPVSAVAVLSDEPSPEPSPEEVRAALAPPTDPRITVLPPTAPTPVHWAPRTAEGVALPLDDGGHGPGGGFRPHDPVLGASLDTLRDETPASPGRGRRLAVIAGIAGLAAISGLGVVLATDRDSAVTVDSAQPSPTLVASSDPSAGSGVPGSPTDLPSDVSPGAPSLSPSVAAVAGSASAGVQAARAPQSPGSPVVTVASSGVGSVTVRVSGVQARSGAVSSVSLTHLGKRVSLTKASGYSTTFTTLTAGQRYSFTGTVCNTEGLCSSSSASYTPPKLPPGAPTLAVAKAGEGQATVTVGRVAATTGTLSSVTVTYGGASVAVPVGSGTAATYRATVSGLTAGQPYAFVARVCNSFGLCTSSATVGYTPPKLAPGKPNLTVDGVGATQARVSVSGVSAGTGSVASVKVDYDGRSVTLPTAGGQATVSGLTAGKQYSFTATVCNTVQLCTNSDPATYTVPVQPPKLGTVTLTRAAMNVTVRWAATTSAPAGTACTVQVVSTPAGGGLPQRAITLAAGTAGFTGTAKTSYQAVKTCTYPGGELSVRSSVLAIP